MGAPAETGQSVVAQSSPCQDGITPNNGPSKISRIRRQVEYYFSDSNLPRDRFLLAKMDENEGSWVDIEVLLTFNKMKAIGASVDEVVVALDSSDFIEVNKSERRLRRTTPVPDSQEWHGRSLYAKGWIATDPEPSIQAVETLFAPYGKVTSVRIRRWGDESGSRHFKGSVFVEFENAEAMERAASDKHVIQVADPQSGERMDKELIVHDVDTYVSMKREESREKARKFKERKAARKAAMAQGVASQDPKKNVSHEVTRDFVKGLILSVDQVGENVSREDLKESLERFGDIAWIDFERGQSAGYIRFAEASSASAAFTAISESQVQVSGKDFKALVLDGDAEQQYWMKIWEQQNKTRNSKKRGRNDSRSRDRPNKRYRGGGKGRGRG